MSDANRAVAAISFNTRLDVNLIGRVFRQSGRAHIAGIAWQAGRHRDHFLMQVYAFLNSAPFLGLTRQVTGVPQISYAEEAGPDP